jgi:uncharacterized protein YggE
MQNKYHLVGMAVITAALVLLFGGLVFGLVGFNLPATEAQAAQVGATMPRNITVIGEGKVRVQPDIAQATIGVEIVNSDVKQASSDAAAAMEALLTALKAQGVADNDIQTSYYNIWVERPYNPDGSQSTEAIYHVSNTVQVTIRDLSKVTTTLGAAIEAGANTINSVTFNVADPSELEVQARQEAVDNARATAEELATLNGVTLGEVISVSEVIVGGPIPLINASYAAEGIGGGAAGPLSPGEVEITVQLQVSYAIQ